MLICANCGKVIKECCDIFFEARDENGEDCVLCGECAAECPMEGDSDDSVD